MFHRIILLKLNNAYATDEGRSDMGLHSRRVLSDLNGVHSVRIGFPADPASARSWDVSITLHFSSNDDFQSCLADPDYDYFFEEWLKPRISFIKAWNFKDLS